MSIIQILPTTKLKLHKSQVGTFFNEVLGLMERAYEELSKEEFKQLEDKIKNEIAYRRKAQKCAQ